MEGVSAPPKAPNPEGLAIVLDNEGQLSGRSRRHRTFYGRSRSALPQLFPIPPLLRRCAPRNLAMESLLTFLREEPIGSFAVLLAVILIVPQLFERLRLPGLLGLLAAGIALGPNGLHLLQSEEPVMELLSDTGLLYLMFVAGLEIDLQRFRLVRHRAFIFGGLTFALPLSAGILLGRSTGFDWNS